MCCMYVVIFMGGSIKGGGGGQGVRNDHLLENQVTIEDFLELLVQTPLEKQLEVRTALCEIL